MTLAEVVAKLAHRTGYFDLQDAASKLAQPVASTYTTEPIEPKTTGAGRVLGVYLDGQPLESSEALEELRHLVEALKQTTARLDLVATRHDERLATLEHERGRRIMATQTNEELDQRLTALDQRAASGEYLGKVAERVTALERRVELQPAARIDSADFMALLERFDRLELDYARRIAAMEDGARTAQLQRDELNARIQGLETALQVQQVAYKVEPQPLCHPALQALDAEEVRLRSEVCGVSPLHAAARRERCSCLSWHSLNCPNRAPETKGDADQAYNERNRLVALLARIYPSGIRKTAIEGWDPCWHGCVFVDTPMGQMSWHYHDRDADLFAGLPPYTKDWDGHSTPEKYARLERLTRSYWAGINSGVGDVFHEAMNEAFREGRRRERASLIGHGDGVTVIIRDYPALIGDAVSGCHALRATRVLVDAAGPGASVLRALEQAGLPAEALPKGGL